MEEEVGFEPTDVLPPTVFKTVALSQAQPLFLMEHRAAVEAANAWVAIRRLLHFAFRCPNCWQGTRDSNPVGTGLESVARPIESGPPCGARRWIRTSGGNEPTTG